MDIKKLGDSLHPLERAVLPFLENNISLGELMQKTKLKEVEVMRAIQWLENKNAVKIKRDIKEIINLDENGEIYLDKGLPEKRFLESLDKEYLLGEIKSKTKLDSDELSISLGLLKKKGAITFTDKKIKITEQGEKLLKKETLEEQFLDKLPLNKSELSSEEKYAFNELIKRKRIIKVDLVKEIKIDLTDLGEKLSKTKLSNNFIDSLTNSIIKNNSWKTKKFRRYDVEINVPKIYPGKRHFVNQAINYIRRIWLDLGFKEMTGNIIQPSFWNFDALFQPQDHPARDLQDSLFLKDPEKGKLPKRELVNKVKRVHETGDNYSKGWQYSWDEELAKKNCLRTHTTALSARTLAQLKKSDLPAKFFAVGKNFRNETVDWSHLFELVQVEGIVVDENANFEHLIGYLKEFFKKMGFEKVRVRPGYFPYTEMSAEVDVFHPVKKQWVELGGSGIFRTEVVKPLLGEDIPVLAWGLGLERTIMGYYDINDIRLLYKNDIKQLREIKTWLK